MRQDDAMQLAFKAHDKHDLRGFAYNELSSPWPVAEENKDDPSISLRIQPADLGSTEHTVSVNLSNLTKGQAETLLELFFSAQFKAS